MTEADLSYAIVPGDNVIRICRTVGNGKLSQYISIMEPLESGSRENKQNKREI